MSSDLLYPLGEIEAPNVFSFVGIIDGDPAYLDYDSRGNYYWNASGSISNVSSAPTFSIRDNGDDSVSFIDTVNGGWIGVSTTNNTLANTTSGKFITLNSPTTYTPGIILSMTPYTLSSNDVVLSIYSNATLATTIAAQNLLALPTEYMYDCSGDVSTKINGQINTINTWIAETLAGSYTPSWIELQQCKDGYSYSYCLNPNTCGNNGCYGPCSDGTCEFNGINYSCNDPIDWKRWLVVFMIVIIVISLIIAVIVSISHKHKKDASV